MEATTIALVVGVATLLIKELFQAVKRLKKSSCMKGCCEVEMRSEQSQARIENSEKENNSL